MGLFSRKKRTENLREEPMDEYQFQEEELRSNQARYQQLTSRERKKALISGLKDLGETVKAGAKSAHHNIKEHNKRVAKKNVPPTKRAPAKRRTKKRAPKRRTQQDPQPKPKAKSDIWGMEGLGKNPDLFGTGDTKSSKKKKKEYDPLGGDIVI